MWGSGFTSSWDEPSIEIVGSNTSVVMNLASTTSSSLLLFSADVSEEMPIRDDTCWIACSNTPSPTLIFGSNQTEAMIIDRGHVGIGVIAPNAMLHIGSNTITSDDTLRVHDEALVVAWNGNVGIGTMQPVHKLHCNGDVFMEGVINMYHTSDARMKDNIRLVDLSRCYQVVKETPLRCWKWKDTHHSDMGWIAQEVEDVAPEAVRTCSRNSFPDFKMINQDILVKHMFGALQLALAKLERHERVLGKILTHFPQYKKDMHTWLKGRNHHE